MPDRKFQILLAFLAGTLILVGLFWLWPAQEATAQCGSQASSCKNCHEVQGKDPVNNDGTGWHQSHAFGDFCYLCHAGNNQSMDETEAHTGMVPPLSDVKAACQQCHLADLDERAQVYATTLGVEVGAGGGTGGTTTDSNTSSGTTSTDGAAIPDTSAIVMDDTDVIDYNMRYEGKTPINWGDVVVVAMIVLILFGGGAFVFYNERKRKGLPFLPQPKTAQALVTSPRAQRLAEAPVVAGYSNEITALLPLIAQLNPIGLHALQRLLENPEQANEMLNAISQLDPELVRRVRNMDRDSRALLLAVSGD